MLTSLALIFLLGISLGAIFNKLKLPSLIGMMISGIILGPYMLNLIDESLLNISADLRQVALVIILTRAGLSLNIGELRKVGRPALLMCFVPACFEILAMILFAPKMLGITTLEAAIMGSVVAAVSPAVIVPRMIELKEKGFGTNKNIPQLIMAGASVDDVLVIVLFTSFTSLGSGQEVSLFSFASVPISIILGIVVGFIVGKIFTIYFKRVHIRDTIKIIVLLCISFIFIALENMFKNIIPFSGLLAVMSVGISLLHNYPTLASRISTKFSKLWVVAQILLFVLVGATIDISFAINAGAVSIMLVLLVLVFRVLGVYLCLLGTNLNKKEKIFCMIAYIPKATVQAAIGGIPLAMGLDCGSIVLTVAVISIIITAPLGAIGVDFTYKHLLTQSLEK